MKPIENKNIVLFDATLGDIKTLANHHREMFKEISEKKGEWLSKEN